jgi:hypothetical protein
VTLRRYAAALVLAAATLTGVAHPAHAKPECAAATGEYRGAEPWPQARLGLARAWPLSTGSGVTVAVVSTGVEAGHAQFGRGQVLAGADVRGGTPAPGARDDCDGRGTFAAGLVAGHPSSGTTFAGVAPGVRILPVRYTGSRSDGRAGGDVRGLARGIRYATSAGAQVIVVVSAEATDARPLRDAVAEAIAADVVVVSAGTPPRGGVTYPTAYAGVLGVTAVAQDGTPARDAERGAHIAVAAPGSGLIGPAPRSSGHAYPVTSPGMAAAFAGGVVALVRAYRPRLSGPAVVRQIRRTATPLSAGGPAAGLGAGIVDAYAAVAGVPAASATADGPGPSVVMAAAPTPPSTVRLRRGVTVAGVLAAVAALLTLAGLLRRRRVSAGST